MIERLAKNSTVLRKIESSYISPENWKQQDYLARFRYNHAKILYRVRCFMINATRNFNSSLIHEKMCMFRMENQSHSFQYSKFGCSVEESHKLLFSHCENIIQQL